MNTLFKWIFLILLFVLNFSCVQKNPSQKNPSQQEASQQEAENFKIIHSALTDTLKFVSAIRSVFQDSKGNYWFGSSKEGVSYYNGKSFRYFTHNEGLADNQVRSIQEDENGNIWFGTAKGVSKYDGRRISNVIVKNYNTNFEYKNADANLWFGAAENPGIILFDGNNLNYLPFPIPENVNLNHSYGVTDISKGDDGKLWIATYASLFYFDGKTISIFDASELALKKGEVLHIRSVLADSKGRIWIGNNGIGVLLHEGNSTINFSDKHGLIDANSSKNGEPSPPGTLEHVFVIHEDLEGNIWFGDRDTGAWKFDGTTMTNYTVNDQLSTPMIYSIYTDSKDNLLFGMEDGGVYKFNGESMYKMF